MKILKPSIKEIVWHTPDGYGLESWLERVARTCYQSYDRTTEKSAGAFIERIVERGHVSIVEFLDVSAILFVDRGTTHQLVRHRVASYAQESSRYCRYSKDKFDNEITFIEYENILKNPAVVSKYLECLEKIEETYMFMLDNGVTTDDARSILPTCTKSEIVIKCNLREWLRIFELRTSKHAHEIIRKIMIEIESELKNKLPCVFGGLK